MKIETHVEDDLTIVAPVGEFIGELAPRFTQAVSRALAEGRRDFLVDLTQTKALDSGALEALTALNRQASEQLGMLHLCVTDAALRKIFEITRLDRQLSIHGDIEEARRAFGGLIAQPAGAAGGQR